MMQIDDGKNFKAFLESEKRKANDPATRAKFDKLIAEIDEVGSTITGLPAIIPPSDRCVRSGRRSMAPIGH